MSRADRVGADARPTDIPALLRDGLPAQAEMAHRPGGNFDTRGDAALVRSPAAITSSSSFSTRSTKPSTGRPPTQ